MDYKIGDLTKEEAIYIGEKINEIVPREVDAEVEKFVLKVENENGEINEEKIKAFLSDSKRIYEVQMNGLQEESAFSNGLFTDLLNDTEYVTKNEQLMSGAIASINDFAYAMSVQRVAGFENTEVNTMHGQSSNVYLPKTMVGINAATKNQEEAILQLAVDIENGTADHIQDYLTDIYMQRENLHRRMCISP